MQAVSVLAVQQRKEHEDNQRLLQAADRALEELEATRKRLQRAADMYRERLEGRRGTHTG